MNGKQAILDLATRNALLRLRNSVFNLCNTYETHKITLNQFRVYYADMDRQFRTVEKLHRIDLGVERNLLQDAKYVDAMTLVDMLHRKMCEYAN